MLDFLYQIYLVTILGVFDSSRISLLKTVSYLPCFEKYKIIPFDQFL